MKKIIKPIILALVLLLAFVGPAQAAKPKYDVPDGAVPFYTREVNQSAREAWLSFWRAFPRPHRGNIGACTGGPVTWTCPGVASDPHTYCTGTLVLWKVDNGAYTYHVFEIHQLRCIKRR